MSTRMEHDLIGDKEISNECYYGVQTARAAENFHITGITLAKFPTFITSLAKVKKAAALANYELGLLSRKQKKCDL
jgi:aspartate ammonia-lyase